MKKFFMNLLLCLATVLCLMGFAACGETQNGGTNGTYYLYRNGDYVKSSFFKLESDKWTDDDGATGTFTISNGEITFYYTEFGETFDLCDGTISNGVLYVMGDYYCKEGKTPTDVGNGGNGGDSGSSENTSVQFTVTYDANGGTFENGETTITETINANATLTAPQSPKKANYTFDGWATSAFGTEKWNFAIDQVTKEITLYAVWTQQSAAILSVDGASINGQKIFMLVNKNTDSVSLSNKVVCSDNSIWKLYYDKLGQMEIPTKIAASTNGSLLNGDNVFYVVVTSKDGTQTNLYELNVHRSYAVSVRYYDGETLLKTDTAYTGYEYTANYTPNITGYTFNDWNYTKRVLWDNLNLYVDKTANTYTVTYDVNGGDELTTTENSVIYNQNYTLAKPTRTGYTFLGWYQGSTQLTDGNGKSLEAWKDTDVLTVRAKWIITDMLQFEYVECQDEYCITGIKDKTVTNIVVPDCVVEISVGAFYDCSNLTSITLPFVGESKTAKGYKAVFGYIFGYYTSSSSCEYIEPCQYYDSSSSNKYYYYIPASLKEITITGGNIPSNAFYDCDSLTSITIPDSVTSIGGYAFYKCYSLTSVYITDIEAWCNISFGDNYANPLVYAENLYLNDELLTELEMPNTVTEIKAYAFSDYSSLTSVVIPDSVTSIGNYAFQDCDSLTSVVIPDSVTSIGNYAFQDCDSLTEIKVNENNTAYKDIDGNLYSKDGTTLIQYAIGKTATSFVIPDSVTSIGNSAFWGCSSLTSVTIPNSVTSIADHAFAYCSSLTSVTIPNSVTSIADHAFFFCDSLTSVEIPDSVTSIGNEAFAYCDSLTSIEIPDSVTSIGYSAFYDCDSLTSITIPDSVTSIADRAFSFCDSLTSVIIPDSVTSIGRYAFQSCESLKSVTFGENSQLTSIGDEAFRRCRLTSLTIPDGVTSIGDRAFYECRTGTSYLRIPDSVTSIGDYAFVGCGLTSVVIPNSVTSIGDYAFEMASAVSAGSVYCEASSRPNGWSKDWCTDRWGNEPKVYWGQEM